MKKISDLILLFLVFSSCRGLKSPEYLCKEWEYLKYPVIAEGYIGVNSTPQGDICYQRKWMSYVGLSKACIIELLGKPAVVKGNEFIYYFSSNPQKDGDATGVLHLYFRNGKMKSIRCSLA